MNFIGIELNLSDLWPWTKKPPTVLVVEDDAATTELIRAAAEAAGYQVEAATTAEEALGILHRNGRRFVVAMIDVRLPGMSGWVLRRRMLSFWPNLNVLIMSSAPESFSNMPQGETLKVLIKGGSYAEFFRSIE